MPTSSYCAYPVIEDATELGLTHRTVDTPFGSQHIVTTGPRTSDRVTIFLHGISGTWAEWTPLLAYCQEAKIDMGDCLFVDLPGFGVSENRLNKLVPDLLHAIYRTQIEAGGWSDVEVVGHSMGGLVALDLASRNDLPISHALISCGTLLDFMDAPHGLLHAARQNPTAAAAYLLMRHSTPASQFLVKYLKTKTPPWLQAGLVGQFAARPHRLPRPLAQYFFRNLNPTAGRIASDAARKYDTRQWRGISRDIALTVVYGAKDRLVPPHEAQRFQQLVPHSRALKIEDSGHLANVERADFYANVLYQHHEGRTRGQ